MWALGVLRVSRHPGWQSGNRRGWGEGGGRIEATVQGQQNDCAGVAPGMYFPWVRNNPSKQTPWPKPTLQSGNLARCSVATDCGNRAIWTIWQGVSQGISNVSYLLIGRQVQQAANQYGMGDGTENGCTHPTSPLTRNRDPHATHYKPTTNTRQPAHSDGGARSRPIIRMSGEVAVQHFSSSYQYPSGFSPKLLSRPSTRL